MMRSFGAPADWQTELPDAMFARISKSLIINTTLLSTSEWRSRDETIPAVRLREILGSRFQDDDGRE